MSQKQKRTSLILRVACIIGLIVLASNIGQFMFISGDVKKESVNDEIKDLRDLSDSLILSIENKLEGYNKALDYYVNADVVQTGNIELIAEWLLQHKHIREADFDYVMIAGPDGNSYNDIGTRTKISDRPYFKAVMNEGKASYIGNPVLSRTTGQSVLHIARALQKNGKTFGIVTGVVNLGKINGIINEIKIGEKVMHGCLQTMERV